MIRPARTATDSARGLFTYIVRIGPPVIRRSEDIAGTFARDSGGQISGVSDTAGVGGQSGPASVVEFSLKHGDFSVVGSGGLDDQQDRRDAGCDLVCQSTPAADQRSKVAGRMASERVSAATGPTPWSA